MVKENNFFRSTYFYFILGRKVAIDASMCIYQFLIAVRQEGNVLTNQDGETTRYIAQFMMKVPSLVP